MARPRRSQATTTKGRFLASRIQDARRRGATNAEIARAYGINERTVRKIRSGETSGARTFGRLVEPSEHATRTGANPSIVRVDIKLANGNTRSVNARIPTIRTRDGGHRAATPADVFMIPGLVSLLDAEMQRLARQYPIEGKVDDISATVDDLPLCSRWYCHHDPTEHIERSDGVLMECIECRCPQYRLDDGARVLSFRPITLRRKPLRIEISGYQQ